tara:strand:- start:241 stop:957 length:717 start_codon:yes stop_codon:yes gene_type:complete
MITKSELKKIKSLKIKKNRQLYSLFVAEGKKNIQELVNNNFKIYKIFSLSGNKMFDSILINQNLMNQLSFLKNPSDVFGVFYIPKRANIINENLTIALDNVSDPGNLGNIIRICDWFGIKSLICSINTVDCYNPKVIQSSMGSISRVNCIYRDINDFLINSKKISYGTVLDGGSSIYSSSIRKDGILIFGNESNGISKKILNKLDFKITIPKYNINNGPDSLNISSAASIVLANYFKK